MRKLGVFSVCAFVVAWCAGLLAAPTVGPVALTPQTAVVGRTTVVTATAVIQDPLLIPASVNLQQLDAAGKVVAIVGTLRDDGTNGDTVAGDKTFTVQWSIQPATTGQMRFQVSAGFKGLLRRVSSDVATINVTDAQWTPRDLDVQLLRGTQTGALIQLTVLGSLQNATLEPSPEIAHLLTFIQQSWQVLPGGTTLLPVRIDAPIESAAGAFEGSIALKQDGQAAPTRLRVAITVLEPTASDVPSTVSAPSADRVSLTEDGVAVVRDELLVMLSLTTPDPLERIEQLAVSAGGVIAGSIPESRTYQIRFPVPNLWALEAVRQQLLALPDVAAVSHNVATVAPLAALYPTGDAEYGGWSASEPGRNNWNLTWIKAPAAWGETTGEGSVSVGVIEYAFDRRHPDLVNNVAYASDDPWWLPLLPLVDRTTFYHGTHVAGTACAQGNNGIGIAGVAWNCGLRLYTVSPYPDPDVVRATTALLAEAMTNAWRDRTRIVNISLGLIRHNTPLDPNNAEEVLRRTRMADEANDVLGRQVDAAIQHGSDVLWVFAAGNESEDAQYQSPAGLGGKYRDNVIAVASHDNAGRLATDSNYGSNVEVAAPGVGIWSSYSRDCYWLDGCPATYGTMSGTSMAAPHVAGLAALVLSKNPAFTARQVKKCIVATAHGMDLDPIPNDGHSFYSIDAAAAVECAGGGTPAPPPAPPGTVLLLHMDETSGAVAHDSSGYGNSGTVYGTTVGDGAFGNARAFPGVDSAYVDRECIVVPASSSLNITGELTIDAWIRPTWKNGTIVAKWDWQNNNAAFFLSYNYNWDGRLVFFLSESGDGIGTRLSSNTVIPSDGSRWYRVTAVFKPSTYMKIFIDGVEDASLTTGVPASLRSSATRVYLGASELFGYSSTHFGGSIDELRISNVATAPSLTDWTIVPGVRVGPVALGMARDAVRLALGSPDRVAYPDSVNEWWYYFNDSILITFQNGTFDSGVRGVKCYSAVMDGYTGHMMPGFAGTVAGTTLGPASSSAEIRRALGPPDEERYDRCWYYRLGISFIYGDSVMIGLPE